MSTCCNAGTHRKTPLRRRTVQKTLAWLLPSALLAFVPKCPACLAAYLAIWTGIGLSLSTATYLRWVLISLAVASLFYLMAEYRHRIKGLMTNLNVNSLTNKETS